MELIFQIKYEERVFKEDIPSLSVEVKSRIKNEIEKKLSFHPEVYGKPLRKSLKGYRKLRVGDYRVIFRIEGMIVKIFVIQHRSVVYKK